MESNCGLALESSDDFTYCNGWWNLELKVNMIGHEMSFKFLDLHFPQKINENLSELFSIFSIEDSFAKLWTNDNMISTIPSNMRSMGIFLVCGVHGLKKGYDVSSRVFLQSLGYHNLFSSQRLQWQSRCGSTPRGGRFRQMD